MNSSGVRWKAVPVAVLAVVILLLVLWPDSRLDDEAGDAVRSPKVAMPETHAPAAPEDSRERGTELDRTAARPSRTLPELLAELRALGQTWASASEARRIALLDRFVRGLDAVMLRELLAELPGTVNADMLLPVQRTLFRELAHQDPRSAVLLANALPSGIDRDIVELEVALAWADIDLPAAASWLAQWDEGLVREIAAKTMGAYLADTDPEQAAEWIAALPDGAMKTKLLEEACSQGGGRAFDAVLAWAQTLPEGPQKERSLIQLSYQWEQRDFEAALAYAENQMRESDALAVLLANQWVEREPESASAWAANLPEGDRRQKILASLTARWAKRDPRAAADFVYQHLSTGQEQFQATISVVSAWAAREPGSAAEWVERFPNGPLRKYAVENLVYSWAENDPAAAIEWLANVQPGPERDEALRAGSARLIDSQPEMAARWAAAFSDEKLRRQKTEQAARAWLKVDADEARRWIEASDLPTSLKQELTEDAPPL